MGNVYFGFPFVENGKRGSNVEVFLWARDFSLLAHLVYT